MASLSAKAGGVFRTATHVWVKAGGVWRDCTGVFVRSGGVWRQAFALVSATYTAISATINNSRIGGGANTSTLTVKRDGTWTLAGTLGSITITGPVSRVWVTPQAANSGDTRWVMVTSAGDAPTGTLSTWLALTSDLAWTASCAPFSSTSTTLTVSIATDAAGASIVSTGTVNITQDND